MWTPSFLDDIFPPRDPVWMVFGIPELCEHILAPLVAEIFNDISHQRQNLDPHKHRTEHDGDPIDEAFCRDMTCMRVERYCPLVQLFRCRHVCKTFQATIDNSPSLRKGLFLEPASGFAPIVICFHPPDLAAFRYSPQRFHGTISASSGTRTLETMFMLEGALGWQPIGDLWESMFVTQPPVTTMTFGVKRKGRHRFGDVHDLEEQQKREVKHEAGITFAILREEAKNFAQHYSTRHDSIVVVTFGKECDRGPSAHPSALKGAYVTD